MKPWRAKEKPNKKRSTKNINNNSDNISVSDANDDMWDVGSFNTKYPSPKKPFKITPLQKPLRRTQCYNEFQPPKNPRKRAETKKPAKAKNLPTTRKSK